jgi:hypothetical protein
LTGSKLKLLALACPRSGTRYLCKTLRNSGVPVGHEYLGYAGTVGMFFAVEDCWYPGKHWLGEDEQKQRRSDYEFEQVWHFTRDPRLAIASIASTSFQRTIWPWQERHTGISSGLYPKELRAMKFWVAWNELIEKRESIDLFFRIEDIDEMWPVLCERLGLDGVGGGLGYPKDLGSIENIRQRPVPMTWDEMKSIDNETYLRVREMATRYGYEG